MNEPMKCEKCNEDIKGYLGLEIDAYDVSLDEQLLPLLIHASCYKEINEKAWKYDELG